MKLRQIFCWHKYIRVVKRSGFYGDATLFRCSKCKKEKVEVIGYPSWFEMDRTKVTHYDDEGKEIDL